MTGEARAPDGGSPLRASRPERARQEISRDPYGGWLGIELLELRPGYCRAAMRLAPHMLNFQGSPHGGAIFSLADFAFGAACNAHGEAAVALSVTIQFLAAVPPGARLVAEARAERQGRRAGFYLVTVTAEDGTAVASCQAVALRRLARPRVGATPAPPVRPAPMPTSGWRRPRGRGSGRSTSRPARGSGRRRPPR